MFIKTIYDIRKESIIELFNDRIFLRGEGYYEEGKVKSIEPINSNEISGVVQGNQDYIVSISINDNGRITCTCSCPYDFNCKHEVALLLKWLEIKKTSSNKLLKKKQPLKNTIDQQLSKKSKEELVDLLKTFIDRHPELKTYVSIQRNEIVSKIQGLFSYFWEWNEVRSLISQLEILLEGIHKNYDQWDENLLDEMKTCSIIMINNVENVHDDGDLSMFLKDWFQTYGELFSFLKPTQKQKEHFILTIFQWIEEDEYGLADSYKNALIGMCSDKKDIDLIMNRVKSFELEYYEFDDYYSPFVLQLYDKIGMDDVYVETAIQLGRPLQAIDKLISLEKYVEALQICKENDEKDSFEIDMKRASILESLGRSKEWQQCIISLIKQSGNYRYVSQLREKTSKDKWERYRKDIINDAENKQRDKFLSRLYYDEKDYKKAYEYSQNLRDDSYLELLADKLGKEYPTLACTILKKLCFEYIQKGSGWPYKKAAQMIENIKQIDQSGEIYRITKQEVINKHKKKWSLMEIIEEI